MPPLLVTLSKGGFAMQESNFFLTKLTECVKISSTDNGLCRDTWLSLSGLSDPGYGFLKIRIYPLSGKVPIYENSMNLTGNK